MPRLVAMALVNAVLALVRFRQPMKGDVRLLEDWLAEEQRVTK